MLPRPTLLLALLPSLGALLLSSAATAAPPAPAAARAGEDRPAVLAQPADLAQPDAREDILLATRPGATAEELGRRTAQVAHMLLKVVHPVQVRASLITTCRTLGGFPILISDERLRMKVPPAQLSALLRKAGEEGLVLEKSSEQTDLTEEMAQIEGRIRSKQEIFQKLRSFFDSSTVEATLQIERTMTDLVQELEKLKGELRVKQERTRWAEVDIDFTFQQRGRIVYVHSPFAWINSVDLDRFQADFWR